MTATTGQGHDLKDRHKAPILISHVGPFTKASEQLGCNDVLVRPQPLEAYTIGDTRSLHDSSSGNTRFWYDLRAAQSIKLTDYSDFLRAPSIVSGEWIIQAKTNALALLDNDITIVELAPGASPDCVSRLKNGLAAPSGCDSAKWLNCAKNLATAGNALALLEPPGGAGFDEVLLAFGFCLFHFDVEALLVPPHDWGLKLVRLLLETLELACFGIRYVSCPTCGRCRQNLTHIVEEVKRQTRQVKTAMTVAIMGCEVNGPGEARHADIGIAASGNGGVLFRNGRVIAKLPPDELVRRLVSEILEIDGENR